MKVLITGVTGFVGSHLLDYIVANNLGEVYGTKRPRSPMDNIQSPVQLMTCDITDYHSVSAVIDHLKPDRVFHLAAQSLVDVSWSMPEATFDINLCSTLSILEAVRHHSPQTSILFAGSSEQYGLVYQHECPITERNPLRPRSPYAVSKVAAELLCRQYVQSYNLHIVTTRAFNHTGPRRGETFATSNFAKQIALIEKGKQEPTIRVGNLEAKRDWTDVRDMVKAYWLALEKCTPGEPYNICSGNAVSVSNMLHILLGLSTAKPQILNDQERIRPSDVPLLQGSSQKFRALTGWETTIAFYDTLKDLLDYWRARV